MEHRGSWSIQMRGKSMWLRLSATRTRCCIITGRCLLCAESGMFCSMVIFSLLLHEHPQVFAYARTFEGQQIRIYCNFTDRDAPLPEALCKEKVLLTNVNYEKTDVLLPYEAAVVMA